MDFILFTAICAFFAMLLFLCIMSATEALAMNCSNCVQSRQSPVKSPKSCNLPPSCESFYSLDILFPDEELEASRIMVETTQDKKVSTPASAIGTFAS